MIPCRGKFDPKKFHDEYRANLERLIEQKQKDERVTAAKSEKPEPVSNILDALRESLAENTPNRVRTGGRRAA